MNPIRIPTSLHQGTRVCNTYAFCFSFFYLQPNGFVDSPEGGLRRLWTFTNCIWELGTKAQAEPSLGSAARSFPLSRTHGTRIYNGGDAAARACRYGYITTFGSDHVDWVSSSQVLSPLPIDRGRTAHVCLPGPEMHARSRSDLLSTSSSAGSRGSSSLSRMEHSCCRLPEL